MLRLKYLIVSILLCTEVHIIFTGRKNELNVSKGDPTPLVFWPIKTSKHNRVDTSGKQLAMLYDVDITVGPTTYMGTLDALDFKGISGSHVKITNENSIMDGDDAMCWMFYLYFTTISQNSILLQYKQEDNNEESGFQLGFNNGKLTAKFYDQDYNLHDLESSFILTPLSWNFVGINFNKLWDANDQFDFFTIDTSSSHVTKNTHGLGAAPDLSIKANGSLWIGSDYNGSKPFNGQMACIQFYDTSIIGGTQKKGHELCDPTLWTDPDYGDYTVDAPYATTTDPPTTESETTTTSTTSSTTAELSTEHLTTDITTPTETHTTDVNSVSAESSSVSVTTVSSPLTTGCNKTIVCYCYGLEAYMNDELIEKLNLLRKNLYVDKKTTSVSIRSRTSVGDDRFSARAMGGCGAGVLVFVILIIIISDVADFVRYKCCARQPYYFNSKH